MAVVRFANNLSLTTQQPNTASVRTDPYPMGGQNYADVRVNTEVIDQAGAGAARVDIQCEASNDGQSYSPYGPLDVPGIAAVGVNNVFASAPFAFIRFVIVLSTAGGAAGDMAWTTLDIHVNFTHS